MTPTVASAEDEALALHTAARQMGLALDDATAGQLLRFLDLLLRWNATYNLTSVRDRGAMRLQHLVDCLAVIEPLRRQAGDAPKRLLDVGSGGGLPGIVIALLLPTWTVACVDTVGKKAAFIRQAALELGAPNLRAEHGRVEALKGQPFNIIVSRAFASLADFVRLTRPQLAAGATYMAMKGKIPTEELAGLPADVDVFHVEQLAVPDLGAERCLVWDAAQIVGPISGEAMFGIADFPAFCTAILVFLALPGPGTFALLTSTSKGGFRAGAAATLGLIAGDQVLLWLAVAGVAALLAAYPVAFNAVKLGGAAYLGWIGLRLLFAREGSASPIRIEPRDYAKQAFLITLLNPKAIVFYMAFFPLFIDPATHRGIPTFAAMAATIAFITATYCLTLCACATAISQRLRANRRAARWLERLAGLFLIGFGIRLLRN